MKNTDITTQIPLLTDYQKERLYREIFDFIQFNEIVSDATVSICPIVGSQCRRLLRKVFLRENNATSAKNAVISLYPHVGN